MKILTVLLLIAIWLCIPGCGGEETLAPTIVRDTTPPTIIATNVQGGPIPVNTPIVLVFSERVNLTSAQRGISLRSSIDAEIVKGVVTLENQGREAKFTPILPIRFIGCSTVRHGDPNPIRFCGDLLLEFIERADDANPCPFF